MWHRLSFLSCDWLAWFSAGTIRRSHNRKCADRGSQNYSSEAFDRFKRPFFPIRSELALTEPLKHERTSKKIWFSSKHKWKRSSRFCNHKHPFSIHENGRHALSPGFGSPKFGSIDIINTSNHEFNTIKCWVWSHTEQWVDWAGNPH
jgi:hypothetical protein